MVADIFTHPPYHKKASYGPEIASQRCSVSYLLFKSNKYEEVNFLSKFSRKRLADLLKVKSFIGLLMV